LGSSGRDRGIEEPIAPSNDGIPTYAVSIMEFREKLVANKTQYFADRFDPAPSRAHLVERAG
jgi:hypothetical protein